MDPKLLAQTTLLYVEDEADVREQTTLILEDFFHRVIAVGDGAAALKAARQERVDLLITDLLMPGQSGLELIAAMRAYAGANLPCLITTAHTDTHYLLEAIELGVDGYILKPLNAQRLLESAYKALLPIHQSRELAHYRDLINTLGLLVGGRKIDILRHLINHLDEENYFRGSYGDIMAAVDVSKPTVIRLFRDLMEAGALERVKNGLYRFKSEGLTRPRPDQPAD